MLHIGKEDNVQRAPVAVSLQQGQGWVKVELAIVNGHNFILSGWRVGRMELSIHDGNVSVGASFFEFPRQDVNQHFKVQEDVNAGFSFVIPFSGLNNRDRDELFLSISEQGHELHRYALTWTPLKDVPLNDLPMLGDEATAFIHPFDSEYWRSRLAKAPRVASDPRVVMGFMEASAKISGINHVIVNGWFVHADGVHVWLEDAQGRMFALEHAFRYSRPDVVDAVFPHFGDKALSANFCVHLDRVDTNVAMPLKLMALGANGVQEVTNIHCASLLCSIAETAKWLFGAVSCHSRYRTELSKRILLPVLSAVNQYQQRILKYEHVDWHSFGPVPDDRASLWPL